MDFLIGIGYWLLAGFVLSIPVALVSFYFKQRKIHEATADARSGIYIEHGMVTDRHTGVVKPQMRPSRQASLHF